MIRTQILLTPSLYDLLKVKAEEEKTSLSFLVRSAVEKMLKSGEKTGGEILQDMAKHAVSDKTIPTDLSTNDDYIYGKNTL